VPDDRRWLLLASGAAPLGLIAVEAGWTVTEVGRQPWVVTGVLRTADAVTPMPGLWAPMLTFTFLYLALGVVTVALLLRQFRHSPMIHEEGGE
jgi:cytochrome d ubiquinol oxidase subunit I